MAETYSYTATCPTLNPFFSNTKKHLPSSKRGPDVRVDQAYAHRCILPPSTAEAQLQIDPQLPYKHTDSVNPFQPPAREKHFLIINPASACQGLRLTILSTNLHPVI